MRRIRRICCIFVLLLTGLICSERGATAAGPERLDPENVVSGVMMELSLQAGYRNDQLDWSIAGNSAGTNPNVLSELSWDDLEIYQLQIKPELSVGNGRRGGFLYHVRGLLGVGEIVSGANRDSDYAGDNRTLEFSRSNNSAGDGDVLDLSVAAGLEFRAPDGSWSLTPLVGFSYHEQDLRMFDGHQTLSEQSIADDFFGVGEVSLPPLGPIAGLNSRYETEWSGPWLGLELLMQASAMWMVSANLAYHWADFEAVADWNLRQDLAHPVSFSQRADGNGLAFTFGLSRSFGRNWTCQLDATYQDWQTDDGTDLVHLASGSVAGTRLNSVNWESFSLMLGLGRRF